MKLAFAEPLKEDLLQEATATYDIVAVMVRMHTSNKNEIKKVVKHVYYRGKCIFKSEREYVEEEPAVEVCTRKYGNLMDGFCSMWA